MRSTTILGMVAGLGLLAAAVVATAHDVAMFLNGPGIVIVLGGTVAATLMSYSVQEIGGAFRAFWSVLRNEDRMRRADVLEVIDIARIRHHGDIHDAETAIKQVRSPFLRTGLQMVIDGAPTSRVVDVLDWRISRLKAREFAQSDVFSVMATYAPAFGMVGTLLGLVNMLRDLGTAGIEEIATNLALALVTTFYGIVLANAVFKPMAVKLRRGTQERVAVLNLIKEAVVMFSEKTGPYQLQYSLESFLGPEAVASLQTARSSAVVAAGDAHVS